MDPALKEAAANGDINFLIKAISQHPSDYFLTQFFRVNEDDKKVGNLFHIAAWNDKVEFIKEAIQRLPGNILNQLLFEKDQDNWAPLYVTAIPGDNSHETVKLILDYYLSMPSDVVIGKPWLGLTNTNARPLHVALLKDKGDGGEDSAMELLLMDVELLSNMVEKDGDTPVFLATRNGFTEVAEKILTSCPPSSISFSGSDGSTPLHFAPNCSENVFKLLLKKNFSESIDKIDNKGYSVLHQWVDIGEAWPCKLLLESNEFAEARTKIFKDLVFLQENTALETPLHISTRKKESELSQILVRGYQQVMTEVRPKFKGRCQQNVHLGKFRIRSV